MSWPAPRHNNISLIALCACMVGGGGDEGIDFCSYAVPRRSGQCSQHVEINGGLNFVLFFFLVRPYMLAVVAVALSSCCPACIIQSVDGL